MDDWQKMRILDNIVLGISVCIVFGVGVFVGVILI